MGNNFTLRGASALAILTLVSAVGCSDVTQPTEARVTAPTTALASLTSGTGVSSPLTNRLPGSPCAFVLNESKAAGAAVVIWNCFGSPAQTFSWMADGSIRAYASTTPMCLTSVGTGQDGDSIQLQACAGSVQQKWTATAAGEIRGMNGKCLDVYNANPTNGTRLMLWNCYGSPGQKWDNVVGSGGTAPPAAPPAAPPTPPVVGIAVLPRQSIQAAVNANPVGTTFILKAGTHTRQSVIPKSGDVFQGEPGTVLDGQGAAYAFSKGSAPYPSNVTIRGIKITGYTPPMQSGTVEAGGNGTAQGTTGWVIDGNEIAYNGEYGIRIGNAARIVNNNVHHNTRLNIAGSGNNTVVENNEIAFGNYQSAFNTNFEAGGTKFTYSDGLVLRNNYVHDNVGDGLWLDENNINTIIEGNRIDRNGSGGISIEISYKTTIRNNTVTNNGWSDPRNRYTYLWNAGIGVHASPNVEIYGNTVSGNYAGVVAIEQNRSMDRADYGAHIVQNLYVHDNIITQSAPPRNGNELSVGAGIATDIAGNSAIFTSRNNRYVNNTYYLGSNPRPFAWNLGTRTEAEWRSYGQDTGGVFNR